MSGEECIDLTAHRFFGQKAAYETMKQILSLLAFLTLWPVFSIVKGQSFTVEGYILERDTEKPVKDAVVQLENSKIQTTSGTDGHYSLSLPKRALKCDTLVLKIQQHGYKDATKYLILPSEDHFVRLDVILQPLEYQLSIIEVVARKQSIQPVPPLFELNAAELEKLPKLGEIDVFRAAQVLPGVGRENDFSAQLIIRGGEPSQHLILVDDVPLWNAFHLGGTVSIINSDIVSKVDLFASNYPPLYSGASSSVLAVRTKEAHPDQFRFYGSLDLLSSKISLDGPVSIGTLMLGARRTYFDLLAQLFGQFFPYYFYDLFGKYRLMATNNHSISSLFYFSRDHFNVLEDRKSRYTFVGEQVPPQWGNTLAAIEWLWIPAPEQLMTVSAFLTSSIVRSSSRRYLTHRPEVEDLILVDNSISQHGAKGRFEWKIANHQLAFGLEFSQLSFRNNWEIHSGELSDVVHPPQEVFFDFAPADYSQKQSRTLAGGFALDKFPISESLTLMVGGRFDFLSDQERLLVNPFLRAEYIPTHNLNIHASYGQYYQSTVTLSERQKESVYSAFAIPFLPDKGAIPTADHTTIGVSLDQLFPDLKITLEGYRLLKNQLPSISIVDRSQHTFMEETMGIDLLARYKRAPFEGLLSYSVGESIRSEKGVRFPGNFDQRHMLKIFLSCSPSDVFSVSLSWFLYTGFPYSSPASVFLGGFDNYRERSAFYPEIDGMLWLTRRPVYTYFNSQRSATYHRLDLTVAYGFIIKKLLLKTYLTFINVYGKNNPIIVDIDTRTVPPKKVEMSGLPLVAIIGVRFEI